LSKGVPELVEGRSLSLSKGTILPTVDGLGDAEEHRIQIGLVRSRRD
jgi:hypothetical protein